jgi:hypothetical protein
LNRELDIPHWARNLVAETRARHSIPSTYTDRQIYARVVDIEAELTPHTYLRDRLTAYIDGFADWSIRKLVVVK